MVLDPVAKIFVFNQPFHRRVPCCLLVRYKQSRLAVLYALRVDIHVGVDARNPASAVLAELVVCLGPVEEVVKQRREADVVAGSRKPSHEVIIVWREWKEVHIPAGRKKRLEAQKGDVKPVTVFLKQIGQSWDENTRQLVLHAARRVDYLHFTRFSAFANGRNRAPVNWRNDQLRLRAERVGLLKHRAGVDAHESGTSQVSFETLERS